MVDDAQAFCADPLPEAVTGALGEHFDRIHFTHMEEPLKELTVGDPSAEIAVV